eukprot:TRINITY_DN2871_c0_g2_i2.p1 TRINITY_DN2871_c0_g2~~TRINITY_DN2871_c0_g2_i2.p1  ORF type:complete len:139 (-),score=22.95 TRINITY_DN2871_c0_g2_i2:90-506(-)
MKGRIRTIEMDKYEYVIVLGGANDLDDKPTDVFDNLAAVHNYLRENGVVSIAVTIPENRAEVAFKHMSTNRKEINRLLIEFCTKNDIPLLDLATKIPNINLPLEERDKYWSDSLHFTPFGYDTFGELLFELLDYLFKQ